MIDNNCLYKEELNRSNSYSGHSLSLSLSRISTIDSSSSCSEMWRYAAWLPFLLLLWSDTGLAESTILLPSQAGFEGSGSPVCSSPDPNLNYRPVIGILSHPGDGASGRLTNDTSSTYIAASYVKFAEAGGARVIPLIYNEPEELLFQVPKSLVLI